MISIKKIDNGLMSFLTTLRYPKRLTTPFSQFLFAVGFNLTMALMFAVLMKNEVRWVSYVMVSVYLLAIFYHWRLWRQLETKR